MQAGKRKAVTIDSDVVKQNIETVTVDSNAQPLTKCWIRPHGNRTYEQENKNDDDNMPREMAVR